MTHEEDSIGPSRARYLQKEVYRRSNALQKVWWFIFGMPPAKELAERLEGGPFNDEEEERIREIVREESSHSS
jgi:hypothetical protein